MNRRTLFVAGWLLTLAGVPWTVACQSPATLAPPRVVEGERQTDPGADGIAVYVASNGWHTGIAVPRAALPPDVVPEAADFPDALFLEFGWGDDEYYPAPRPTFGLALRALLRPTPAVIHLVGLPAPPRDVFPSAEVVELRLAPDGFRRLADYLDAAFARHGAARAQPSAPGLYAFSRFYPATGEFHLFNTCNTWTARGLAAAGLPVETAGTVRAEDVMAQVRGLAARVDLPSGRR